ncbi:unnamed protein product [Urochloa humidicola]
MDPQEPFHVVRGTTTILARTCFAFSVLAQFTWTDIDMYVLVTSKSEGGAVVFEDVENLSCESQNHSIRKSSTLVVMAMGVEAAGRLSLVAHHLWRLSSMEGKQNFVELDYYIETICVKYQKILSYVSLYLNLYLYLKDGRI